MGRFLILTIVAMAAFPASARAAEGNAARGQRAFGACAACHSLEADKNMTGPSLSAIWNRKAGALSSFTRYSPALKSSGVTWNDKSLDAWIADPQHMIPGNEMTFPGIKESQARADLLAFLKDATKAGGAGAVTQAQKGGMEGMMGGGSVPNLKKLDPEDRIQTIAYCRDTYTITTADGKARQFWERNLRVKTDSSGDGPTKGAPALVPAGMMGDRADAIFATPEEIGQFVLQRC